MSSTRANTDELPAGTAEPGPGSHGGASTIGPRPAQPTAASRPAPTSAGGPAENDLERILKLAIPVSVILAERDLDIASILEIKAGTIIEFDAPFDADLTLAAANQPIGSGQAVKAGENFGIRLTQVNNLRDRIQALAR